MESISTRTLCHTAVGSIPSAGANARSRGFTLSELLVVMTILVILAALLLPSISRARYNAKLVVCESNLRQIVMATKNYAIDNENSYPYCPVATTQWKPTYVVSQGNDIRTELARYIPLNILLNDPLVTSVNINDSVAVVTESTYCMFFGWGYSASQNVSDGNNDDKESNENGGKNGHEENDGDGEKSNGNGGKSSATVYVEQGMNKMGQPWTYKGRKFHIVAGDQDIITSTPGAQSVNGSHPDASGTMGNLVINGAASTLSRYNHVGSNTRGLVDLNFAYDDGSVRRYAKLPVGASGMTAVPEYSDGGSWPASQLWVPDPNKN